MKKTKVVPSILVLLVVFLIVTGIGFYFGNAYIDNKLLQSNEAVATDMALLIRNHFQITDKEVTYMKSLTFNEMEVDAINRRLMDMHRWGDLDTTISNIYIIAPLATDEIKYYTDKDTAGFFGYDEGVALNGIWLLNGRINTDGTFEVAQRKDIYRYTRLDEKQTYAIENQTEIGTYCSDAWGSFVTGYAPLYTTEGNFIGLLGLDMALDKYQADAQSMLLIIIAAVAITVLTMSILFLSFYFKYTKAKVGQIYSDFYSRMSHDMRTPMNGILGMVELSKDETDIEVLHHNFEMVENSGTYMLSLINDTLDLQKIETGKLNLNVQIWRTKEILDGLVAMIIPSANQKEIDFQVICDKVDMESYMYVDAVRIKQICINLLSNAIKFTPEKGTVKLIITCLGRDKQTQHLKWQVIDSGVGMSRDFMKNGLFKPFEQENNAMTTQYAGSGLGLAITKSLVDIMGGEITVESEIGKGTTFTVYIDIQEVDAETAEKTLHKVKATEGETLETLVGKHILLCEDHPLNREIAKKLLEKVGCRVDIARDGQEGVDAFAKAAVNEYDAVLMDIRMPVMDGLEAAKQIRALAREDAKDIPIIAMTANAYDEDIRKSLAAGMNAHLSKPINPTKLYSTLAKILQK